jgi:hypothetical protein
MNRDDLRTIDLALPSGLAMEYARAATTTTSTRKSAPRAALEAVAAPRQPCCPASARESFSAPSNYMGLRTALHAHRHPPCGPQHENKWAESPSPSGMPSPGSRLPCSSSLCARQPLPSLRPFAGPPLHCDNDTPTPHWVFCQFMSPSDV